MKKILFFSTPAYGHLTAVHPVITHLVSEGNEVVWYCSPRYKDFVLKSGAHFEEYAGDFDEICNLREATADLYSLFCHLLQFNRRYFIDYDDKVESLGASMILYDSMCSFAKNIAVKHGIPHVCFCTTVAYNAFTFVFSNLFFSTLKLAAKHLQSGMTMVKEENDFRRRHGIKRLDLMDVFVNKGDHTLVFSPKEFQPMAGTFGSDIHFVGTTIGERVNLDETQYDDYDIYISLGTISTEQKDLLDELLNSPYIRSRKVIMNVGSLDMTPPASNIRLVSHTNQLELLKHCKLFINHGGLNSVYESIASGVVQVCIPQQEEQRMNAKRVQSKGVGVYMPVWDEEKIKILYQKDAQYNKRLSAFADIMKQDGTCNAVKIINSIVQGNSNFKIKS